MPLSRPKKRRTSAIANAAERARAALVKAAELLNLYTPRFVFDMNDPTEKEQLIDALWSAEWIEPRRSPEVMLDAFRGRS